MSVKNDDQYYIDQVCSGNTAAYSYLVDRYADMVYSISLRLFNNETLAEDHAQEVFIAAFEQLTKFKGKSKFSTWLYRIAYNMAINKIRKKKLFLVDDDGSLEKELNASNCDDEDAEEDEKKLVWAINQLDKQDQVLIMLHYYKNESLDEISKVLGISLSNVKVKLHRLRKKLKHLMVTLNDEVIL